MSNSLPSGVPQGDRVVVDAVLADGVTTKIIEGARDGDLAEIQLG